MPSPKERAFHAKEGQQAAHLVCSNIMQGEKMWIPPERLCTGTKRKKGREVHVELKRLRFFFMSLQWDLFIFLKCPLCLFQVNLMPKKSAAVSAVQLSSSQPRKSRRSPSTTATSPRVKWPGHWGRNAASSHFLYGDKKEQQSVTSTSISATHLVQRGHAASLDSAAYSAADVKLKRGFWYVMIKSDEWKCSQQALLQNRSQERLVHVDQVSLVCKRTEVFIVPNLEVSIYGEGRTVAYIKPMVFIPRILFPIKLSLNRDN